MRDHTKLRAFEPADQLVLLVYQSTNGFPDTEQSGLTSQLRRAALSIPSNIVEGCARNSERNYIRFLDIAYGSAKEVEYQISVAFRLGFLAETNYRVLSNLTIETAKVMNGLPRALRNKL